MRNQFDELAQGVARYVLAVTTCLVPLVALSQSAPIPPPPGLVAWWSADGDASDVLGINNGLINGATFTTGMVGQAFLFDGSGAQVTATTLGLPIGADDRTIELWARLDALPTSPLAFLTGYGAFGAGGGTFEVGVWSDGTLWWSQWGLSFVGSQLQTGQWNHIGVTSKGGTVTIYINGSSVATGALPFNTPPGTSFYLGSFGSDNERLQGALDEISVYNRALSADELLAIYQAGSAGKLKPGPPGPRLSVASSGRSMLIWWPTNAAGFFLETSSSPGATQNWSTFAGQVFVVGNQNEVVVEATGPSKFFRLHHQ